MSTVIKRYLGTALVGAFVLCLAACGNRSLNSKIDDQFIASEVVAAVERAHPDLDSPTSHIVVSSYNAVVLLGGQTPREELKVLAEKAARKVAGVHKLYNELQVLPPTSSLVRGNDALLTSSIKAQMLADSRVASTRVKVVFARHSDAPAGE